MIDLLISRYAMAALRHIWPLAFAGWVVMDWSLVALLAVAGLGVAQWAIVARAPDTRDRLPA